MSLKNELLTLASPGSQWAIWTNEIESDTDDYRIGQLQFENGGLSDGRIYVIDGDQLHTLYTRCFDDFSEDEIDELGDDQADIFWNWLDDEGYFDEVRESLHTRHVIQIHEDELKYKIIDNASDEQDIETDPDIIVNATLIRLIEDSEKFEDTLKALEDWKTTYPHWHIEIKNLAYIHGVKAWLSQVLTASEACEKYGLSESAVRQAISRGQIPARKSGGTWLIRRQDADEKWKKK